MNPPRPHLARFDSPSGLFKSVDEAILGADAIKKQLERLSGKAKVNCLAIIVISICDKGGTKRGRYGSYLLSKVKEKPAHLHIELLIDKERTIVDTIQNIFKDSFGTEFDYEPIKTQEHLRNRIVYTFQQRWKHRTVTACTDEFAQRYCGDIVSFSEEANKATGDGKLVFKKYANMKLETDEIIYDFRRSRKPKNDSRNITEVLTEISANEEIIPTSKKQENEPFSPNNNQNQDSLEPFDPKSETIDEMPFNCSVKYNNYNNISSPNTIPIDNITTPLFIPPTDINTLGLDTYSSP